MATLKKFQQNQKVFAKVRGYPPWPAKVIAALDETPNKQKYQVVFYGTGETAACKLEEIFDYVEFKHKYGKGVKRKHFSEAIQEIEQDLNIPEEKHVAEGPPVDNDDDINTPVIEQRDNSSSSELRKVPPTELRKGSLPENRKVSSSETRKITESRKTSSAESRKSSLLVADSDSDGKLVNDEELIQKEKAKAVGGDGKSMKRKHSNSPVENSDSSSAPEVTSRSGRKIKPKKFSDSQTEFQSPIPTKIIKLKSKDSIAGEENGKLSVNDQENSTNGGNENVELQWGNDKNVDELLNNVEQSELPKIVKEDFKKTVQRKIDENNSENIPQTVDNEENIDYVKTQVQLLEADCRIKTSLSLSAANCDDCLKAMDKILSLKLNPIMLKKHPEVVETVKKLRRYVGNTNQWELSEGELTKFLDDADKIRSKAETMYNKFKSLFPVPMDRSFYDYLCEEVESFQRKTKDMTMSEIYSITIDE